MQGRQRAALSVGTFVIWAVITAFASRIGAAPPHHVALNDAVTSGVQPSYLLAILFLVLCVAAFRWTDIGVGLPSPASSLRLLWCPALYVTAFIAGALAIGLPPVAVLAIITANTFLVGVSEELACRGILYQGLLGWLDVRGAILGSTLLFGAVHLLNGFTTGDFGAAAVQSLTAFMSGIVFLAIRIRTGSLWPGVMLHGVWDCTLVTLATSAATKSHDAAAVSSGMVTLPLLLILPNFLYGLFLLRKQLRAPTSPG